MGFISFDIAMAEYYFLSCLYIYNKECRKEELRSYGRISRDLC